MRPYASSTLVILLASALVAGCASKPEQEDDIDVERQPAVEVSNETDAEAEPVDETRPARPVVTEAPLTADGFHGHSSHYDGTTNTRMIYFAFDRSEVPAAAIASLRAHADYLKRNPNARVRLEGHTDERGTREYNIGLGERRSQSIERFLRVEGVSARQLQTVSYGEEKPAAYGQDEMSWAKNRRVEINYLSGRP